MVLVTTFALLVLFSIVAVLLSAEDTREDRDRQENPVLWAWVGRR